MILVVAGPRFARHFLNRRPDRDPRPVPEIKDFEWIEERKFGGQFEEEKDPRFDIREKLDDNVVEEKEEEREEDED